MRIKEEEINYIKYLCKRIIETLENFNEETKENEYVYQNQNRAKFNRLRIELNQVLMNVNKIIYK